tara:strand:- start:180 stop:785 length:606 start_codon:yes stop_codon:yes gene_type:complete
MLIKILSSKKYSDLTHNFIKKKNKKIGEIGSFSGNNLRYFIEQGFKTYGVEINNELIKMGKDNLKRLGYSLPTILKGNNQKIPISTNFLDCLVSINTIHYDYGYNIEKVFKEFNRVVKKNGLVLIETVGCHHTAFTNSICNNELDWTWKAGGFRNNKKVGFFYSKEHLKNKLLKTFSKVEVYERKEFMKMKLHFYFAVCIK